MDDPVPVRRWLLGCLTIALLIAAVILLSRPAIFLLAPPRGDAAMVVASASELDAEEPIRRDVILSRSYGWAGELDAGDGRVQLTLLLARSPTGAVTAVNGASPPGAGCPVERAGDRLADCDGRTWTLDGLPIDAEAPLERFPAIVDGASVAVDLTRTLGD